MKPNNKGKNHNFVVVAIVAFGASKLPRALNMINIIIEKQLSYMKLD